MNSELNSLSSRTANALFNNGIENRERFRAAVTAVGPNNVTGRWRGMGRESLIEAFEWAEIPLPGFLRKIKDAKVNGAPDRYTVRCPHCYCKIYVAKVKGGE